MTNRTRQFDIGRSGSFNFGVRGTAWPPAGSRVHPQGIFAPLGRVASASGVAVGLADRQRHGQRTVAPVADVGMAAASGFAGRRRWLLRLRFGQATRAQECQLPVADVFQRDALHERACRHGAFPGRIGLLLPRQERQAERAAAAAFDTRPRKEEEKRRVVVDQYAGAETAC